MNNNYTIVKVKVKVKVPRNRPEGPEGGRGIALIFLDLGARRGWVIVKVVCNKYCVFEKKNQKPQHCAMHRVKIQL
jgi:hypothetical protein